MFHRNGVWGKGNFSEDTFAARIRRDCGKPGERGLEVIFRWFAVGHGKNHFGEDVNASERAKRLRHTIDQPYKFKKRGNEEQYVINNKVMSKLEETEDSLVPLMNKIDNFADLDGIALTEAHRSLIEGKQLLSHRQKLIKMADKSESGWRVVDEYQTNEIAEDSDDEKKMLKAEARAARKVREARRSDCPGLKGTADTRKERTDIKMSTNTYLGLNNIKSDTDIKSDAEIACCFVKGDSHSCTVVDAISPSSSRCTSTNKASKPSSF